MTKTTSNRHWKCLNLSHNQITDQGVEYLADVLGNNQVNSILIFCTHFDSNFYQSLQTLTTLDLTFNKILGKQIPRFANTLKTNQVKYISCYHI